MRKEADHDHDAAHISPIQAVVAGIVGTIVVVVTLLGSVRFIVGSQEYDIREINELRELSLKVNAPTLSQ